MERYKDKTILITGASSGIGKAIATTFVNEATSYKVFLLIFFEFVKLDFNKFPRKKSSVYGKNGPLCQTIFADMNHRFQVMGLDF